MKNMVLIILQLLLFITVAPLLSGLITKIKNNLRMRQGQGVFQPYFNLAKLFSKEEVISETASWIFRAAPFIVFSSSLTASLLIPVFISAEPLHYAGDFLAFIFILSLGRFFLALSALDTASAFGGMGASREMFISSFAEPVACLAIFVLSLQFGSTSIFALSGMHPVSVASFISALALFFVVIAETSRIPVDNQETHLELTMVHEAMVLEYSGKSLAIIELASHIKQMIWFILIAQIVFPVPAANLTNIYLLPIWLVWYAARIVILCVITAFLEVSVAKMRLFRVTDFFGFAFVLAVIAVVCAVIGV